MAGNNEDNTVLNLAHTIGSTFRDILKNGAKTQVILLDIGGDTTETLFTPYQDANSNAIGTIRQEHFQVHQGNYYTASHSATIDDSGGANPILDILMSNPANNYPHFRGFHVQSDGGPFDVDFYEGPTVTANGTAMQINNNNRNSSNTATMSIYYGSTISVVGTALEGVIVPGARGVVGNDVTEEWDLAPSTDYLLRITNNTSGAGTSAFKITIIGYNF